MESFYSIIAFLFHLTFGIYITGSLIRSFWFHKRQEPKFRKVHIFNEFALMLLLFFCFRYVELSSFSGEKYFFEYSFILLISIGFYWINKTSFGQLKNLKKLTLPFLGTLFWLSLFTIIKFSPYLPYFWFPLLGLMAVSPILFALLSFSEIHYHSQLDSKNSVYKIIGLGLIPLISLQLLMNLYTPEPWELIKIFNPANTHIF